MCVIVCCYICPVFRPRKEFFKGGGSSTTVLCGKDVLHVLNIDVHCVSCVDVYCVPCVDIYCYVCYCLLLHLSIFTVGSMCCCALCRWMRRVLFTSLLSLCCAAPTNSQTGWRSHRNSSPMPPLRLRYTLALLLGTHTDTVVRYTLTLWLGKH